MISPSAQLICLARWRAREKERKGGEGERGGREGRDQGSELNGQLMPPHSRVKADRENNNNKLKTKAGR